MQTPQHRWVFELVNVHVRVSDAHRVAHVLADASAGSQLSLPDLCPYNSQLTVLNDSIMDMQALSVIAAEVLVTLGESIKAGRLRRGWSVRNVAERVGASPTTISKIERGDPSVAVGTVIETARIVGIDLYGGNVRAARSANAELLSLLPQRGRSKRIANNDF